MGRVVRFLPRLSPWCPGVEGLGGKVPSLCISAGRESAVLYMAFVITIPLHEPFHPGGNWFPSPVWGYWSHLSCLPISSVGG